MYEATLSRCSRVTNGPISEPASLPGPTLMVGSLARIAGLLEQLGNQHRCGWVLLGGLQDEAVAARDGIRKHPHRDHRWEVEGRDTGDHAERLADRVDVNARRSLFRVAALQKLWDTAREFEVLEAARDFTQGIGRNLAVFGREDGRDVGAVLVHEVPDLEQDLGPTRKGRRAPGGE